MKDIKDNLYTTRVIFYNGALCPISFLNISADQDRDNSSVFFVLKKVISGV